MGTNENELEQVKQVDTSSIESGTTCSGAGKSGKKGTTWNECGTSGNDPEKKEPGIVGRSGAGEEEWRRVGTSWNKQGGTSEKELDRAHTSGNELNRVGLRGIERCCFGKRGNEQWERERIRASDFEWQLVAKSGKEPRAVPRHHQARPLTPSQLPTDTYLGMADM
eukprot:2480785-Rhodomonas_salina.1